MNVFIPAVVSLLSLFKHVMPELKGFIAVLRSRIILIRIRLRIRILVPYFNTTAPDPAPDPDPPPDPAVYFSSV